MHIILMEWRTKKPANNANMASYDVDIESLRAMMPSREVLEERKADWEQLFEKYNHNNEENAFPIDDDAAWSAAFGDTEQDAENDVLDEDYHSDSQCEESDNDEEPVAKGEPLATYIQMKPKLRQIWHEMKIKDWKVVEIESSHDIVDIHRRERHGAKCSEFEYSERREHVEHKQRDMQHNDISSGTTGLAFVAAPNTALMENVIRNRAAVAQPMPMFDEIGPLQHGLQSTSIATISDKLQQHNAGILGSTTETVTETTEVTKIVTTKIINKQTHVPAVTWRGRGRARAPCIWVDLPVGFYPKAEIAIKREKECPFNIDEIDVGENENVGRSAGADCVDGPFTPKRMKLGPELGIDNEPGETVSSDATGNDARENENVGRSAGPDCVAGSFTRKRMKRARERDIDNEPVETVSFDATGKDAREKKHVGRSAGADCIAKPKRLEFGSELGNKMVPDKEASIDSTAKALVEQDAKYFAVKLASSDVRKRIDTKVFSHVASLTGSSIGNERIKLDVSPNKFEEIVFVKSEAAEQPAASTFNEFFQSNPRSFIGGKIKLNSKQETS